MTVANELANQIELVLDIIWEYWDADQDSKVGKNLLASLGQISNYSEETTKLVELIGKAKNDR
jgi:hypothetical protein